MLVSEPAATTEYYSAADIIARCEVDFDFFCRVALPDVYTTSFPDFYIGVFWKIVDGTVKTRDLSKFAIGIPRAHAKTTWVKLVIAWLLIFSKKKTIIFVFGKYIFKPVGMIENMIRTVGRKFFHTYRLFW